MQDPSSDDYAYFLNPDYSTTNTAPLDRYKRFNGHEGNSPANGTIDGVQSTATTLPDMEDVNRDNNMEIGENYFQYKVLLKPANMVVGQNYITDMIESPVRYANNTTGTVKWYQFKVPVRSPDQVIGTVDVQNIRFIRMFMKGFQTPVVARFARLELLRGEWRPYIYSLLNTGEYAPTPEVPGDTKFDVGVVSIEENGSRIPVPYVLPPGIDRGGMYRPRSWLRSTKPRSPCAFANFPTATVVPLIATPNSISALTKAPDVRSRGIPRRIRWVAKRRPAHVRPTRNRPERQLLRIRYSARRNALGATARDQVWPEANNMEIELNKLVQAKLARNNAMQVNGTVTLRTPSPFRMVTVRSPSRDLRISATCVH